MSACTSLARCLIKCLSVTPFLNCLVLLWKGFDVRVFFFSVCCISLFFNELLELLYCWGTGDISSNPSIWVERGAREGRKSTHPPRSPHTLTPPLHCPFWWLQALLSRTKWGFSPLPARCEQSGQSPSFKTALWDTSLKAIKGPQLQVRLITGWASSWDCAAYRLAN